MNQKHGAKVVIKNLCYDDVWQDGCTGGFKNYHYPYGPSYIPGYCNDNKVWRQYNQTILNYWKFGYASNDIESFEQLMDKVSRSNNTGAELLVKHLTWLYQGSKAGQNDNKCMSKYGIADTEGNVEEWTLRRDGGLPQFHGKLKGRYWAEQRTCQSGVTTHGDGFRFYEIGFRCCKDCGN